MARRGWISGGRSRSRPARYALARACLARSRGMRSRGMRPRRVRSRGVRSRLAGGPLISGRRRPRLAGGRAGPVVVAEGSVICHRPALCCAVHGEPGSALPRHHPSWAGNEPGRRTSDTLMGHWHVSPAWVTTMCHHHGSPPWVPGRRARPLRLYHPTILGLTLPLQRPGPRDPSPEGAGCPLPWSAGRGLLAVVCWPWSAGAPWERAVKTVSRAGHRPPA
jgi:hypothetical protein